MDAKDQKSNSSSIDNSLSELMIVLGNARKSKGGSLLGTFSEPLGVFSEPSPV